MSDAIGLDEYMAVRDPANAANFGSLGDDYRYSGRWDQAIAAYRTALSLSPKYKFAHLNICSALLGKNDPAGALREAEAEPNEISRTEGQALAWHALGRKADADAALATLIGQYERKVPYAIAAVLAYRGEADRAFEWLGKAVDNQDTGLASVFHEPLFTRLHGDPRWLGFLRKLGKAPEQLAAVPIKVAIPK